MPNFNLSLIREQILRSRQVISIEATTREEAEAVLLDAMIDRSGPVPEEDTGDAYTIVIAGQRILIQKPSELVADDWRLD
jgi:hypothetical protein